MRGGGRPAVSGVTRLGTTAGGESVKVTGGGFETPARDVASVQVGDWQLPASAIHVISATSLTLTMPPARDTLPAGAPPAQDGAGPAQVIVTLEDGQSSATGPGSRRSSTSTRGSHGRSRASPG